MTSRNWRARALAQAQGLSVEEWVRDAIQRGAAASQVQPRDPLFGMFADQPELTDAIDEVVAERRGQVGHHAIARPN